MGGTRKRATRRPASKESVAERGTAWRRTRSRAASTARKAAAASMASSTTPRTRAPTRRAAAAPTSDQPRLVSMGFTVELGPASGPDAGDGDALQHRVEHVPGAGPAQLGLRREDQTVFEHARGQHLEVIGDHIVAPGGGGVGAGRPLEGQSAARTHAEDE